MYAGASSEAARWDEDRYLLARISDDLDLLACGLRWDRDWTPVERPADHARREASAARARSARERIESAEWEEA